MRTFTRLACLTAVICAGTTAVAQSTRGDSLALVQRNPDGWFTVDLPRIIGKVERFADVDGGFYKSDVLEINYDYWTFQNTPNWLRGRYATTLILACSAKTKSTRTQRTWIDGYRAVIQQCSQRDERNGLRHVYYVTFPKLRVFDGEKFRYGMFNFRIEYKDLRYSSVARRMVHSLNFEHR